MHFTPPRLLSSLSALHNHRVGSLWPEPAACVVDMHKPRRFLWIAFRCLRSALAHLPFVHSCSASSGSLARSTQIGHLAHAIADDRLSRCRPEALDSVLGPPPPCLIYIVRRPKQACAKLLGDVWRILLICFTHVHLQSLQLSSVACSMGHPGYRPGNAFIYPRPGRMAL